jgi:hypothetical protein
MLESDTLIATNKYDNNKSLYEYFITLYLLSVIYYYRKNNFEMRKIYITQTTRLETFITFVTYLNYYENTYTIQTKKTFP